MRFLTYADYRTKVEKDLDLENETIIQPEEMMEYCNEGIHMVETVIHDLREDYFLSHVCPEIVAGTRDYDLPDNIFANKIRAILYDDGVKKYKLKRIRDLSRILGIQENDDYEYLIVNPSVEDRYKLRFYPTPRESSSTNTTVWYIRSANRVTEDSSVVDIPEFYMYVLQVMKIRCKEKEMLDAQWAATQLLKIEENLRRVLAEKVEDEQNEIPIDTKFIHDFDYFGGDSY